MDFISPLIEPIVSLVLNPLKRHIGYLVKARTNVQKMTNELGKLRACRDDIQKEIEDAERRQKQSTEEVKLWLERVRTAEDQVVTTKNEYGNRGFCLFGDSSLDCWLAYKYGKRATELLEEMVQLETQRKAFNAIARVQPPGHGQPMLIESTLLGLDRYVEEVQNYLTDETVRVIGIWGMGGVGKTTLMGKVNNSILTGRDKLGFERLIQVVVSREFQLKNLQAQVAKCLGLELKDDDDTKARALKIFQDLEDKSFLLLLDDVWKWVNLLEVGIPNTHGSSSNSPKKRVQKVVLKK